VRYAISNAFQVQQTSHSFALSAAGIYRPMPIDYQIKILLLPLLLHPFNGIFSETTWVSRYQKRKSSRDLNDRQEMMGFWDGSGISWTTCKQSALCSRQITTPTPHHSIFTGRMLFLTPNQQCQSTEGNCQIKIIISMSK